MSETLPKELWFDQECQRKLLIGIKVMAQAVKSTYGTHGRNVLIESLNHTHGFTSTRDGYNVAKSITLQGAVENMACRVLLEAAEKTASIAGDGTTTSIVLAEALILSGIDKITGHINRTSVLRYMVEILDKVIEILKSKTIPCTEDVLLHVATIAANNDEIIGKLISDSYKEVGRDGVVTVDKSLSTETYAEVVKGVKIERGYISPGFINNYERDECILNNAHILVCDTEISHFMQLENIFREIIGQAKDFLIIAPCSQQMVTTLVANTKTKKIRVCIVPPPNFGYRQYELMEDIALSVGAVHFSEKTGDELSLIQFLDLGIAEKVVVSRDRTVIKGGKGDREKIQERIGQLKIAQDIAKKKEEQDFIGERIAALSQGIGVINVGGNTDLEQKELYDRIEDAVCAVRAALLEGILPGAGKPLFEIELNETGSKEYEIAKEIILEAIKAPLIQVLKNADLDYKEIYKGDEPEGHGYNLKTGEMGDLIKMGVIDPLKVTRVALQNAMSVATTVLSTDTSISIVRAEP